MKVLIPIVIGLMIAVIGLSCSGDPAPLSESEIGNKASLFLDSPVVQSRLDLHDDALMLYVDTDDAKWFRKAIHYRSEICSYVESKTSDYSKEDQDKIVSVIFERDEWSRGYFSDKQADKREPEKGSTDDSKPKGFWPWWIYVAPFIVACILYKCIEAWKYGTWDSRRREDRKRKIKKREERQERRASAREKGRSANVIESNVRDFLRDREFYRGERLWELTKEDYEKVTSLCLYNKQLTDVKGLEKLTKLWKLDLDNNQLTNVKGLEKLRQLEKLDLSNNPDLTKAQIAQLKKALPNCKITQNAKK